MCHWCEKLEPILIREEYPPALQPLESLLRKTHKSTVRGLGKFYKLRLSVMKQLYYFIVKIERMGVDFLGLAEDIRKEMEWLVKKRLSRGHGGDAWEDEELRKEEGGGGKDEKEEKTQRPAERMKHDILLALETANVGKLKALLNLMEDGFERTQKESKEFGDKVTNKEIESEWEKWAKLSEMEISTLEQEIKLLEAEKIFHGETFSTTIRPHIDRLNAYFANIRATYDSVRAEIKGRVK